MFFFFSFFFSKKLTEIPLLNCKIHGESFWRIPYRTSHHGWATKKILFSRASKTPVSSFYEYTFLKKINVGGESTSSQWLIPIKKTWLFKLSLKWEETWITFNNLRQVMTLSKGVSHYENQKIHREFQRMFTGDYATSWSVPTRVTPRVPVAFRIDRMVLQGGDTRPIISNYGKSSLHIIWKNWRTY